MIIEAGNDPNSPYVAFGDDSEYEDVLLYAYIICPRQKLPNLERGIYQLKKEFDIPQNVPIHLRNLLSGQYRAKHNITNFNQTRQAVFYRKAINLLNRTKCFARFTYTLIPESGRLLPENNPTDQIQIVEDRKVILHQMAAACLIPYSENGIQLFSVTDFEVFISKDKTKVKLEKSGRRRQAHFMSEALIPTSHPPRQDSYARLKPVFEESKDNIFLQFADVLVYILAHAHSKKNEHKVFKYQASRIKAFIRHTFVTEHNQDKLNIKLPDDSEHTFT